MTEKENHLPNLSSEERAHALELAIQARRRYAALKARVKSGELTFTDAMDEEDAKRILVTSLLQSVPGIGASKAVVIMRLYRIPKGRRVGGSAFGNVKRWLLWKEMDGSCSGLQFKLRMASTNQQQRRKRAPFMVSVRLSRRDWKESLSSLQRN